MSAVFADEGDVYIRAYGKRRVWTHTNEGDSGSQWTYAAKQVAFTRAELRHRVGLHGHHPRPREGRRRPAPLPPGHPQYRQRRAEMVRARVEAAADEGGDGAEDGEDGGLRESRQAERARGVAAHAGL